MLTFLVVAVMTVNGGWSCEDEDARVTAHLEDALTQLRTTTPSNLSDAQLEAREGVLEDLRRYIDAQQFPRSKGPTSPVFVDDADQHCAMGALISWNGGDDVVRHIRATRNLATVPTLRDEPGLADWLTSHGMTVEEAALVQPTYYVCTPAIDVCRTGRFPQTWVANGGFSGLGIPYGSRVAAPDGQCAATSSSLPSQPQLPPGVIHQYPSGLAPAGDAFVHASWLSCPNPPRVTQAALEAESIEACATALINADPRSLLPSCGNDFDARQWLRCGSDGRFLSSTLPRQGVALALDGYFQLRGIDAGALPSVDLVALEASAWANSDDGGTVPTGAFVPLVRWSGTNAETCVLLEDGGVVNDAGVVVDAGVTDAGVVVQKPIDDTPAERLPGCSTGLGAIASLALLLLRRRVR